MDKNIKIDNIITCVITRVEGLIMAVLKLTTIGNSTGVVLPKDLLSKLRVQKGDSLYAVETPDGIELTPYDPEFSAQMELAEKIMRRDRDILRKLAQ